MKKQRNIGNLEPALIFLQADGFSMTYNIVVAQNLSPHDQSKVGWAVIVNSALASELFLKCLICIETGAVPMGHNLKQLFDQLSSETQKHICAIWDHEVAPMRASFWDALERSARDQKKIPRDLPTALVVARGAFEKLRYAYEGNIDEMTYQLSDLPTLLRRVVLHKRPQWRNIRRSVEEFSAAGKQAS